MAPEILEHRPEYDTSCDMWSVGVIIYILLGGYRPFRGDEMMKHTRYGEYKFHERYWSKVSQDAKDLIAGMLTVDPQQRLTAEKALKSPWIQADDSMLRNDLSVNKKQLKNLKFKGAVIAILATGKLQNLVE